MRTRVVKWLPEPRLSLIRLRSQCSDVRALRAWRAGHCCLRCERRELVAASVCLITPRSGHPDDYSNGGQNE